MGKKKQAKAVMGHTATYWRDGRIIQRLGWVRAKRCRMNRWMGEWIDKWMDGWSPANLKYIELASPSRERTLFCALEKELYLYPPALLPLFIGRLYEAKCSVCIAR